MKTFATLRPLQEADLPLVRRWRNHPEVRRYMYTQHEIGEAEHRLWYQDSKRDSSRHLLLAEDAEGPIGFINIQLRDVAAHRAEWGFYLSPEAPRGSGQALGLAGMTYAFDELKIHKLCGEALSENKQSLGFHERLGFVLEARLRDHHFDGQTYHDVVGFGMLRREWQARKRG